MKCKEIIQAIAIRRAFFNKTQLKKKKRKGTMDFIEIRNNGIIDILFT